MLQQATTHLYKSVYLDKSEIEVCKVLAQMRANVNNSNYYESDFVGLLGELAFAKHFNLHLDLTIGKRQNTYDFIWHDLRVDVKTNKKIDGSLIVKQRENIDVDVYALAVLDDFNNNIVHLVGWIEKDVIRNQNNLKQVRYDNGTIDSKYMMYQRNLKKF